MTLDIPYFMTNDDWYYFDYKDKIYKLKDDAPSDAKKSYEEFYKELERKYNE